MPNTLAHLAVQGAANASWLPARYLPWILLGCVLPDVPWIANRVLRAANPGIDPIALDLYCFVQASWAFSALLGCAAAAFALRPIVAGALVAGNALLHLLLDAVEIKPGSGVHLFAPFSWQPISFDLLWPEHPLVTGVTLLGAVLALLFLIAPRFRRVDERLVLSGRRAAVAVGAVAAYVVLPLPLGGGAWDADYRSIRSLVASEVSVRNRVELERDPIVVRDGETFVRTFGREFRLIAEGLVAEGSSADGSTATGATAIGARDGSVADEGLPDGAVVSLTGYLSGPSTIRATELHVNDTGFRDLASIAGLLAVALVWIRLLAVSLGRGSAAED